MSPDRPGPAPANNDRKRVGGFEILAKLGQGGMGAVFKARQISIDRVVALKILPPKLAKNQEYVTRFFREARAAAKLNHPNIVQAIDAGEADGYYYFAMEYVEGQSVSDLARDGAALPEPQALGIARDVALALTCAHEAGIIHRDIKPSNILLNAKGRAKLADLGLARQTTSKATGLTQDGFAIGTPDYISPEQVRGDVDVDGRSDIYSLGATLFHMLTGRPPYLGGSGNEVMAKHLAEPIPNPQRLNPNVSHAAARIIWKAMNKDRERRYPTAEAFIEDVDRLLAGPGANAGTRSPAAQPPGKSKTPLFAGIAVLAALVIAGVVALLPGNGTVDPNGNGNNGNGTSTPAEIRLAKQKVDLARVKQWVAAHPQDPRGGIARCRELLKDLTDPLLRADGKELLGKLTRQRERAADTAFRSIKTDADQRIAQGDYDAAIARYAALPEQHRDLLSDRAKRAQTALRADAEARINAALARVRTLANDDQPEQGLAELDKVKHIKYAALSEKQAALRGQLEEQVKTAAAAAQAKALAAARAGIQKLLDAVEAAVARGNLTGAGHLTLAATGDPELKPAEDELKPVLAVGKVLAILGAREKADPVDLLRKAVGREVTLSTGTQTRKGLLKEVTATHAVLERTFMIDGQPRKRTYQLALAELTPSSIKALLPPWAPNTPDEKIASAICALGKKHAAALAEALNGAEKHALYPRYKDRLDQLQAAGTERAARQAWERTIKPYVDRLKLTKADAKTAGKNLDAFEKQHANTKFIGTVADQVTELKKRIALRESQVEFNSSLPLELFMFEIQESGKMTASQLGRTPTPAGAPITVSTASLWGVAPLNKAAFGDREFRALAREINEHTIPALNLGGCRHISDRSLEVIGRLEHLQAMLLSDTTVTDAGLRHLAQLKKLTVLNLRRTGIGDRGLVLLGRVTSIERLDLTDTKITDGGMAQLARLTNLTRLQLANTAITNRGLAALQRLTKLTDVVLNGTRVNDQGVAALKRALPKVTIHR